VIATLTEINPFMSVLMIGVKNLKPHQGLSNIMKHTIIILNKQPCHESRDNT
jgi:hypothetical protein